MVHVACCTTDTSHIIINKEEGGQKNRPVKCDMETNNVLGLRGGIGCWNGLFSHHRHILPLTKAYLWLQISVFCNKCHSNSESSTELNKVGKENEMWLNCTRDSKSRSQNNSESHSESMLNILQALNKLLLQTSDWQISLSAMLASC